MVGAALTAAAAEVPEEALPNVGKRPAEKREEEVERREAREPGRSGDGKFGRGG